MQWLLELLFPPKCMFCRRLLPDSARWYCDDCLAALPEWEGAAEKVPGFSGCAVAFSYEEPVRGAILRMKFQGLRAYIPQFARWMAVRVRAELAGQYDFVTWVPCSRRRRWQRGFDQAELLARALARELEAEVRPTLLKVRPSPEPSRHRPAGPTCWVCTGFCPARRSPGPKSWWWTISSPPARRSPRAARSYGWRAPRIWSAPPLLQQIIKTARRSAECRRPFQ